MLRSLATPLAAALVFAVANPAHAVTNLGANMTNAGEPGGIVPTTSTGQPRPASFGTATFVLNDAQTSMTMTANIFNIDVTGSQTPDPNDNLTNAHIHAGTTATATWPVVWGFHGAPQNDNNPADPVVTPFPVGIGGTFTAKWDAPEGNNTTLAAQLSNLLSEHAYINFHTTQFSGGEIRGLIQTPEPSTLCLLALTPLALRRRRQQPA